MFEASFLAALSAVDLTEVKAVSNELKASVTVAACAPWISRLIVLSCLPAIAVVLAVISPAFFVAAAFTSLIPPTTDLAVVFMSSLSAVNAASICSSVSVSERTSSISAATNVTLPDLPLTDVTPFDLPLSVHAPSLEIQVVPVERTVALQPSSGFG